MKFITQTYAFLEFSNEEVQAHFEGVKKCKYTWKILKIVDIKPPSDWCFSNLRITTQSVTGKQILLQNGFSWNECDIWDNLRIEYNTIPKIWEEIFWILDMDSGYILRAWKKYFDAYPEIPLCKWWNIPQFSQNIGIIWIWVLCITIIWIWFFWIKKSLKKFKHKK